MKTFFYAIGTGPVVDAENSIIRACSLIQKGEAEGHFDKKGRQEVVDDTTLMQVFNFCRKEGSIKVKVDHGSGVLSTVGWVDNFSLSNEKVLGDFHIYDTADEKARIMEVAAKNPHHMGMSLEFEGKDAPQGDKSFSRCERVLAVALVSDPAANKSLFSAMTPDEPEAETEPEPIQIMEPDTNTQDQASTEDRLNTLAKQFEEFAKKFEDKFPELPEPVATDPDKEPVGSDPQKTYENPDADKDDEETKKVELAAERIAEKLFKKFSATIGTTQLGKPGATGEAKKETTFDDMVNNEVKNFAGDRSLALAHLLSKLGTDETIRKAYAAQRNVKTA